MEEGDGEVLVEGLDGLLVFVDAGEEFVFGLEVLLEVHAVQGLLLHL